MALLIHFYGVNAAVFSLVFIFLNRGLEGVVDLGEAVFEDIGETDQDGQGNTARLKLVYELLQIDGVIRSLVGMNRDMTFVVDREVILSPVLDVISVNRVLNCPVVHSLPFCSVWIAKG